MNIFTLYLARVKRNIHIVIGMSPIGDAFFTRLRYLAFSATETKCREYYWNTDMLKRAKDSKEKISKKLLK